MLHEPPKKGPKNQICQKHRSSKHTHFNAILRTLDKGLCPNSKGWMNPQTTPHICTLHILTSNSRGKPINKRSPPDYLAFANPQPWIRPTFHKMKPVRTNDHTSLHSVVNTGIRYGQEWQGAGATPAGHTVQLHRMSKILPLFQPIWRICPNTTFFLKQNNNTQSWGGGGKLWKHQMWSANSVIFPRNEFAINMKYTIYCFESYLMPRISHY